MKKMLKRLAILFGVVTVLSLCPFTEIQAKNTDTIKPGVFAQDISLEGMTVEEAKAAIQAYVDSLLSIEVVLLASEDNKITCTAGDFGVIWSNPEVVEEASTLGRQGNIVQRYKALKDLEHENKIYPIELDFDITAINTILSEQGVKYDKEAVDMSLTRENGTFTIIEGERGYSLDVENSIDTIYEYMTDNWNRTACSIPLIINVIEPRGTREEFSKVGDVLGTFTTSYTTSGSSRSANVANGCKLIDGTTLLPGDEFSSYDAVSPFTQSNGYYMAGSYLNGRVVDSLGGGICQVTTTLYNAVLLSELDVTQRYNHSMIVTYVEPSADAAIAESSGKDFKFINNTDYPIYIEGSTSNKRVTFTIYGVETRPEGHTVEYVSEVLEVTNPVGENLYPDSSQPIGYVNVTGAHIGYKARLWKVVKENGTEVSREIVNSSSYKMVPRSAVVGVATSDPNAYNEIMAAIGTNSIDHVKNVVAILLSGHAGEQQDTDGSVSQ